MKAPIPQSNSTPGAPIPIMVKVWAGDAPHDERYIARSLPSLLDSDLPATSRVVFVDDRSTNRRVRALLERLASADPRVELWTNPERMGPNRGQEYNFPRVVARFPSAELFVLCDDDVIYVRGWLQRMIAVQAEARRRGIAAIVSGLNVPLMPSYDTLQLPTSRVLLKHRQMALNWLLPRDVYERIGPFRDTGVAFDTDYGTRMIALGVPVLCLQPSYVQNIGYFGAYQSDNRGRAEDFVGRRDLGLIARDLGFDLWTRLQRAGEARYAAPFRRPARRLLSFLQRW